MIYARGTGDGIAWNEGLEGDRKGTERGQEGGREEKRREGKRRKKGGKPQSLRLTSLHL